MKRRVWPLGLAFIYLAVIHTLSGVRGDHFFVMSFVLCDYYNEKTRLFLKCIFPMMLVAIAYDSMRYFYWQAIAGRVHIKEPYILDKFLFGIRDAGTIVTPNEFWEHRIYKILDFFCGFAYLVFVGEYLGTAILLFFAKKINLLQIFSWTFLIVNIMGFSTYYIYPAAPPWYITQYGFGPARMDVHPSAAAAVRFDQLLGTHFFDQVYGRGVDVYGAYPSLHVSYPLLVAWVAWKISPKYLFVPAFGFYLLMCFSAVYLQHHFVMDVVLGTAYALVALFITKRLLKKYNIKT